jgi:hypothetical protein
LERTLMIMNSKGIYSMVLVLTISHRCIYKQCSKHHICVYVCAPYCVYMTNISQHMCAAHGHDHPNRPNNQALGSSYQLKQYQIDLPRNYALHTPKRSTLSDGLLLRTPPWLSGRHACKCNQWPEFEDSSLLMKRAGLCLPLCSSFLVSVNLDMYG